MEKVRTERVIESLEEFALAATMLHNAQENLHQARKVLHEDAKVVILSLVEEAGEEGILNSELSDAGHWTEVAERLETLPLDASVGFIVSNLPYDLAKEGKIVGRREERPARNGKMMKQRVWYRVEEQGDE